MIVGRARRPSIVEPAGVRRRCVEPSLSLLHAAASSATLADHRDQPPTCLHPDLLRSILDPTWVLRTGPSGSLPRFAAAREATDRWAMLPSMPTTADKTQWRDLYDEVVTHGPVHRLHRVHRRVPVPRARLRGQRTGPAAGGRPRRVRPRRQGLRHLHARLSALPRLGVARSTISLFGQARKPEDVIGQYREIVLARATIARVADAGPGRRRRVGAADLGAAHRRDRRRVHVEALGRTPVGRRARRS